MLQYSRRGEQKGDLARERERERECNPERFSSSAGSVRAILSTSNYSSSSSTISRAGRLGPPIRLGRASLPSEGPSHLPRGFYISVHVVSSGAIPREMCLAIRCESRYQHAADGPNLFCEEKTGRPYESPGAHFLREKGQG